MRRNRAIDASDEDLVAFLDDDDVWHPAKLSMQVRALRDHPEAIACGTGYTEVPTGRPFRLP